MTLFALLVTLFSGLNEPTPQVTVPTAEIEGVFVPAGFEGPIVAAPFTESAF